MKKIVLLAFVLVFFSTAVVVGLICPVMSYPAETELLMEVDLPVHNIDSGKNFSTIQEAINNNKTLDGHTILVDAGTYYEHVVVNKPISLIGENRGTTVIDGNGTGNVIAIDMIAYCVNVTGFTIRNGTSGIFISTSDDNSIRGNIVTDNQHGIQLFDTCPCNPASRNTIRNNTIKNNNIGIRLNISRYNVIYHNNFINNTQQAYIETSGYANFWDDDYPSGGNYWDDYGKVDADGDSIGETPYVIDANNTDRYPLVVPLGPIPIVWDEMIYPVELESNSTIYRFQFSASQRIISFNVTGPDGTLGFCNLTIPNSLVQELWQGNFTVLVDGKEPITMNNWTDGTYTYLYFKYLHSEHKVEIVPEFPTWTSILLILILLTVAIAIIKRRLLKTPIH